MMVKCTIDGWIGYRTPDDRPADINTQAGQEFDSEHPVVKDRPELFTGWPEKSAEVKSVPPATPPATK